MHLFICFFVMDVFRKMGGAKEPLILCSVQKWTFCLTGFTSSINDDFKMGDPGVTGDHSFKHGCFPIYIQYLTTALERILISSVVMVLAVDARDHWFESCPDLIFLPWIYLFVSLLRTLFVRLNIHTKGVRSIIFCF